MSGGECPSGEKSDIPHFITEKVELITIKTNAGVNSEKTITNRQHWIQRITFAAETNAACSRGSADTDTHTHIQMTSVTIPSPLAKRRG